MCAFTLYVDRQAGKGKIPVYGQYTDFAILNASIIFVSHIILICILNVITIQSTLKVLGGGLETNHEKILMRVCLLI